MNFQETAGRPPRSAVFGSFFLGESEFALSVLSVQEVVHPPERYAPLPLAPPFLKGLFNLRGTIVPVLDLRVLLRLDSPPPREPQKIAIVEGEGFRVGLLFDRTGEVFRGHDEERCDFNAVPGSVVGGVFKMNQGRRLLQILDVPSLFRLDGVPRPHMEGGPARTRLDRKSGQRRQCISFRIGAARCALGIDAIQEILKIERVDEGSLSSGTCLGTIDLRGATVPVIDFAAVLKDREPRRAGTAMDGENRVIVLKAATECFGLLVDAVDSIVSYFPDDLVPFPVLTREKAGMFTGCIARAEEAEILLLNPRDVLSDAEILEVTRGHSSLYKTPEHRKTVAKAAGPRRTYITFSIEDKFAVEIERVQEILESPPSLLRPPGLPSHFKGVLPLRGEMIPVVDARKLYAKPETVGVPSKILILKSGPSRFGMVVDAVEEIVTVAESEKVKLPDLLYGAIGSAMTKDVQEAVAVDVGKSTHRNLLILSPEAIAARLGPT